METAVALIIFNRPETTARVFEAIAAARPPMLLVVADGPRTGRPGEAERCAAARAIIDRVDWPCDVRTNYADANMGTMRRCASGLDWVFDTVEEAIILEDDCVPHPTFFPFCEELLARYRDDERVAHISGTNYFFGKRLTEYSYYFSRTPYIWGWASWRRAWRHYDVGMSLWPTIRDGGFLGDYRGGAHSTRALFTTLESIYSGIQRDIWDYQWTFACWAQNGLAIAPSVNLVTNIGFGSEATHTVLRDRHAGVPTAEIRFPLEHPPYVLRDPAADAAVRETFATPLLYRPFYYLPPRVVNQLKAIKRTCERRLISWWESRAR